MPKHKNAAASSRVAVRSLRNARLRGVSAIAPLLLAACAGDVVNLGENEEELSPPSGSRCQSSTTLEGSVLVENQEQLDALEGCEVIAGDLEIRAFPAASLRSLYALARVEGNFALGTEVTPPLDELSGEEWTAQVNAIAESLRNWLESLEGLERLEAAGTLSINAPISSLQPLSGLRYITSLDIRASLVSSLLPLSGLRHIRSLAISIDEIEDLTGLEDVQGIDSLTVGGAKLRDISALRLPELMTNLGLSGPIEVLNVSEVKMLSYLGITGTTLENLDAFENLEWVEDVNISYNGNLQNLDGLNKVEVIDKLYVVENDALQRLGEFASLLAINSISIEENDNLLELSSFPSMRANQGIDALTYLPTPRNLENILIRDNASLQHLALPDAWTGADFIRIMGNIALEDIHFGGLASAGTMSIIRNKSLAHVSLGALSTVATLQVSDNPLLPPTDFDGVRTFESELSGYAGAP